MDKKVILLRHAETSQVRSTKSEKWYLSPIGIAQAKNLIDIQEMHMVDIIFSSPEAKAIGALKPIAKFLNLEIGIIPELDELKRSDVYLTNEEYLDTVQEVFRNPNSYHKKWETVENALKRFRKGMGQILQSEFHTALVCSHGLVLTLYFCYLLDSFEDAYERWRRLKFCSYGIIRAGQVIKDIV